MSHGPYREYVIDGAEMKCSLQTSGSMHNGIPMIATQGGIILIATDNDLVRIQEKPVCTEKDKTAKGCYLCLKINNADNGGLVNVCEPELEGNAWSNPRGQAANTKTQESHYFILDDASIKCKHGGVLTFVNSGQKSSMAIPGPGSIAVPREIRTFGGFPLRHWIAVWKIGVVVSGSNNISTIAALFANGLELKENPRKEGSQVNAFRHTFWQAVIANEYGAATAHEIANAHENNPLALEQITAAERGGLVVSRLLTSSESDEIADLRNNIIGRKIGSENPGKNNDALAKKILEYYKNEGLHEAIQYQHTLFYTVEISRIDESSYQKAVQNINDGLDPNDSDRQNRRG